MHDLTKLSGSDAPVHYDIKPVVETILGKGTVTQGTYENAKVTKHAVKYGALCTVQYFAKTWLDHSLKEGTV